MADRPPLRGEIWLVETPGQPYDPHQPRPALVVSANARNWHSDDLTLVPILSRGTFGPTRVAIDAGTGGLPHESVLFCEEIFTIHRDFVSRGPLGPPVPDELLRRVVRAVRRALGDPVPEP
ncbi:MAG: type II toxin-antitoxin system PemK/MazF family toxin [Chloroflexi bacterium]|nr:type II toxin-antitoxin system PemK/MazF family toxin [Chloroflexota bacterium]